MHVRPRSVLVALVTAAVGVVGLTVLGATPSNAVDAAPDAAPSAVDEPIAHVDVVIDSFVVASFPQLIDLTSNAPTAGVLPPPTIVLRRPLGATVDGVQGWHQALISGDPQALKDVTFEVHNAEDVITAKYYMEHSGPWRIEVTKSKAPVETVTFQGEVLLRIQP
jgi:hypothetical protein